MSASSAILTDREEVQHATDTGRPVGGAAGMGCMKAVDGRHEESGLTQKTGKVATKEADRTTDKASHVGRIPILPKGDKSGV